MIRWKFRLHAAPAPHPQPCGDRGGRGRVRAGLQRPHRRDRRGEVHPRRGSRSAPRRSRVRRPGSDRRSPGHDRSHLRRRPRRRDHRPSRGDEPGPQPVVHQRGARDRRRRFANCPTDWSSCTASTSTRRCSIPSLIFRSSTSHAGLESLIRASGRRVVVDCRRCANSCDRSRMDGREKAARLDLIAFQLGEIEKAAPQAWRRRGARHHEAGARQRRADAASVRGVVRRALRQRRGGPRGTGGSLETSGRAGGARPAICRLQLEARDGIKSQLEDLAFFLRRYARRIDASPARLQQVEDRLALLERLKRKYGPTLAGCHCDGGRALPESVSC